MGNWVIGSSQRTVKDWEYVILPALLLLPIIVALAWGVYFADDTYIPLHYAQNLAAGKGLTGFVGDVPLLRSPLWTAVLTLAAFLHLPLTYVALVLSALGWGVTAVLLYKTSPAGQNQLAIAVLPGLLLGLNPVILNTLGNEVPWLLALALLALRQPAVLPLLPLTYFNWPTGVLIVALLGWYVWQYKQFTLGPLVGLLLTTSGWAVVSWWQFGRLFSPTTPTGLGSAVVITVLFFLMGRGLPWLIGRLGDRVRLSGERTAVGLALFIGIPFLVAQSYGLWQRYRLRSIDNWLLQVQIGQWLHEELVRDAPLFSSAQIGYLAQQPVWQWPGQRSHQSTLPDLLPQLVQQPPAAIVSAHTLPWQQLIGTGWFQERYHPAATFQSPYEPRSPFTIWSYQESAYDQSELVSAQIQAENGLKLAAYQYGPTTIAPNEAVYVTLYWEAAQPITTTFNTVVRLASPLDQVAWAQRDLIAPRSVPPAWLESGDWFAERFVLTTTAEIPTGGYELNLSLYQQHPSQFTNLYQGQDRHGLDRVVLGYVAVPWTGEMETAVVTNATFDNQIQLTGYELTGNREPGASLSTTLYWEALRPPDENYTVFVHLLDENGQLITNHDGPPSKGNYPTRAWQPGDIVPDEHLLTLPPDLVPGRYRLNVGLYLPETGERLPVVTGAGTEAADRAFRLEMIDVP